MKNIVIYPGKFQPFSRHHYEVYMHLCKQFPQSDVYIVTSNKTTGELPFNFNDKKLFMAKFGVPINRIVCERNPYSPEFVNNFDVDKTTLICAYSDKDLGRISYTKKDGTPAYYQPYGTNMEPLSKHGYIYMVPKFSINYRGNELSGTFVRNYLKYSSEEEYIDLFGWWDSSIYQLIKHKLQSSVLDEILVNNVSGHKKISIVEDIFNTKSSLNIARNDMPQIDDVDDLISWLNSQNINNYKTTINTARIKLTQSTIDDEKVNNILKSRLKDELFIVSNEYYLLDGHHRFVADRLKNNYQITKCLVIDMPTLQAINKLKEYPNIKHKNI
jgi:hypoxanthine phosphoribosyltransferase